MKKILISLLCAAILFSGTVLSVNAKQPDRSKEIEAMSKWLDGLTLSPSPGTGGSSESTNPGAPASQKIPTETDLKDYANKVFELVNKEREKAGVAPVVWDDEFAACAQIRAEELQYLYSHTRPVQPKDTTKVWPQNTNGKGVYNAPSVADEQGIAHEWIMENIVVQRETPEAAVSSWMKSEGHKKNILRESHVRGGVGVYYTNEDTPTGYSWFWVIWFDSYEA